LAANSRRGHFLFGDGATLSGISTALGRLGEELPSLPQDASNEQAV